MRDWAKNELGFYFFIFFLPSLLTSFSMNFSFAQKQKNFFHFRQESFSRMSLDKTKNNISVCVEKQGSFRKSVFFVPFFPLLLSSLRDKHFSACGWAHSVWCLVYSTVFLPHVTEMNLPTEFSEVKFLEGYSNLGKVGKVGGRKTDRRGTLVFIFFSPPKRRKLVS